VRSIIIRVQSSDRQYVIFVGHGEGGLLTGQ